MYACGACVTLMTQVLGKSKTHCAHTPRPNHLSFVVVGGAAKARQEDTTTRPPKPTGGSPYQLFQNDRLASAKRLAPRQDLTQRGSWTADALQRERSRCKEAWQALPIDQKRQYTILYEARLDERRRLANLAQQAAQAQDVAIADSAAAAPSARSHWHYGTDHFIVHPKFVQEALSRAKALPSPQEVHNPTEFAVQAPEPGPLLGGDIILDPCPLLGRNVCRNHPDHDAVTRLHLAMKTMIDRLGKATADSGEVLFLFEGTQLKPLAEGPGPAYRVFALLSQVTWSPRFCDWTLCVAEPVAATATADLQLPVLVDLETSPVQLAPIQVGGPQIGLRHETSDDLALHLSAMAWQWEIRICQYALVSPMRMKVTGFENNPVFCVKCDLQSRVARTPRPTAGLSKELAEALALNAELQGSAASGGRGRGRGAAKATHRHGAAHAVQPLGPRSSAAELVAVGSSRAETMEGADDLDKDDTFEGDGASSEDEGGVLVVGLAELLEGQPAIDEEMRSLTEGLLLPKVDRGALMAADLAAEDAWLPDVPTSIGIADLVAGAGSASSGAQAPAAAASSLDQALEGLDSVVGMAVDLSCNADVQDGQPSTAAAASSSSAAEGGASLASPPAALAAVPDDPQGPLAAPPPPKAQVGEPIADGPIGWAMTDRGYVFDADGRHRGRITMWGTSVSVKCTAHGCSKAKGRAKVTNGQLAHWLARGDAAEGDTAKERRRCHELSFLF